ncbi:hypothetical protein Bbelb_422370 [Branchiostoma belcheri]|nr:hypothetical protein Bbelb_422370 [Branchiostoma belcheri]
MARHTDSPGYRPLSKSDGDGAVCVCDSGIHSFAILLEVTACKMPRSKRKKNRETSDRWCGHCQDIVPKSTYHEHCNLYGKAVCDDGGDISSVSNPLLSKKQKLTGRTDEESRDSAESVSSGMESTDTNQLMTEVSKIPAPDMDTTFCSVGSESSSILEAFVQNVTGDVVKAYKKAEEGLTNLLLNVDAHPTDDSGKRKQAVQYVLQCLQQLDQHARIHVKEKLNDVEMKLGDNMAMPECTEKLQEEKAALQELLYQLKDDSNGTSHTGNAEEGSSKPTSHDSDIEDADEETWWDTVEEPGYEEAMDGREDEMTFAEKVPSPLWRFANEDSNW